MRTTTAFRRLWPDSLFGQLCVIVVAGGLSIQLLFSSIWYDVRYSQVLEVPTRLVSFRTVDTLQQLASGAPLASLATETFHPERLDAPLPAPRRLDAGPENVERMLREALERELGHDVTLELLNVQIRDENGHARTWAGLFGLSHVVGHFDFQLRLAPHRWLHIEARQEQGWNARSVWRVLLDYGLRVYLLRALALVAVALLVVRLSTRPLRRLVRAASALGHNLQQPPIPVEGPKEMRQAAETFNAMQHQLIDLLEARTQLLAAVSHDLRTPLTRMRLRAEGIGDERLRGKLIDNIAQMEGLIRSLLDSASENTTPTGNTTCDLSGLITAVADDFTETGSDVHWHASESVPVAGHAASLRRVLHNLIDNALRHAGNAHLSLRTTGAWAEVTIEDDGPGLDGTETVDVTQPYVQGNGGQGDGSPTASGGYGLGLSIVRSIVMAHRGRLTLTNRPGGGLRVVMALPRAET
ncbi:ATP-binding protein [Salinicola aestuarinus]|uniref:ATP-binding protein n=1 Tax=Salinicola aestuarinus TaxID=1949082 RepID=UPI000DA19FE8|nr:ATP-binding protein [Salinicola aestuarinus]